MKLAFTSTFDALSFGLVEKAIFPTYLILFFGLRRQKWWRFCNCFYEIVVFKNVYKMSTSMVAILIQISVYIS